ncbi:Uu.00g051870.m01.CDS01 [Anthostomella pinea]|uniref:Uu.00g051870.m01.CDS01 n=1 Tax=Anthostomella pinea TaxID=933095 RepID=A0AAI8VW36_9PEZI|nr:Uu.00g051870.m01.CDS01 [Anthostomella pinea]
MHHHSTMKNLVFLALATLPCGLATTETSDRDVNFCFNKKDGYTCGADLATILQCVDYNHIFIASCADSGLRCTFLDGGIPHCIARNG